MPLGISDRNKTITVNSHYSCCWGESFRRSKSQYLMELLIPMQTHPPWPKCGGRSLSEVIGVNFFDSRSCSKKRDSCSCTGALWKFTLQLLFALWKLEGNVCPASWGKIAVRSILPLGVVHKWPHSLTGGRGSPDLWQILTRGRGESVVLWCHTSRIDMHATRSHTRKERCGGRYVSIPFTIVICYNHWINFCRYC